MVEALHRALAAAHHHADLGVRHTLDELQDQELLALARQPLWAVGGWLARLDDEGRARRLASEISWDVEWALQVMREVSRWQAAFA